MADTDWTHDPGSPDQTDEEATGLGFEETADEALDTDFDAVADIAANSAEADAEKEATEEAELAEAAAEADKVAELTGDLQRLSAEFANYRRRVERDRVAEREQVKAGLVGKFLALADDLELAEQHGDLADGTPLKAFADKFRNTLAGEGAEKFGAAGEEFNPEIHEAVQDLSSGDDKVIDTVLRAGYRVGDRVVRSAMVILGDSK